MAKLIDLLAENDHQPTTVRLPDWEEGRVMTVFAKEHGGRQYLDSFISHTDRSLGCRPYQGQLLSFAPMSDDYVRCTWPQRKP